MENAIRPTKLGAKNWLFIGREEAGQSAAVLYTIMANCRRLGIDPREYLVDVLTRLPAMQASEAAELLHRPPGRRHARAGPCVKWRELIAVIATANMTATHPVRQHLHTVL